MTAARKVVKAAQQRSLERALREERLALSAIVKVMLIEVPDPARVLARLDAMTRAAEANPRTPAAIRRQLIDASRFVRTAIQRETGRPQALFDPHVGHVKAAEVDALVAPTDGPQQLGLQQEEGLFGDVEVAHRERVDAMTEVHTELISLLTDRGKLTDRELHTYYTLAGTGLPQTPKAITERRRELVSGGRLKQDGRGPRSEPAWNLIEHITHETGNKS